MCWRRARTGGGGEVDVGDILSPLRRENMRAGKKNRIERVERRMPSSVFGRDVEEGV